jgi:exodeoxyribonuclease VIII
MLYDKKLLAPLQVQIEMPTPKNRAKNMTSTTENKIVENLLAAEYHADKTRVSKHGLDLIRRAPAVYHARLTAPPEGRTPAQRWGTLVHLYTLEWDNVPKETAIVPGDIDRRTKAGKEAWDAFVREAGSREPVTRDEHAELVRIAEAVHDHPTAGRILAGGYASTAEMSLYWTDTDTGVKCRARPDQVTVDMLAVDLKTTLNASADAFQRDAWKYRYHVQAAFYLDALRTLRHPAESFVFIAVEKEPPYLVQVFVATDEFVDAGRVAYKTDLETYKSCLGSGLWPGFPTDAQPLTIPAFAKI